MAELKVSLQYGGMQKKVLKRRVWSPKISVLQASIGAFRRAQIFGITCRSSQSQAVVGRRYFVVSPECFVVVYGLSVGWGSVGFQGKDSIQVGTGWRQQGGIYYLKNGFHTWLKGGWG